MDAQEFQALMMPVMETISARPIDKSLEDELNETYPAGGDTFEAITAACTQAIEAGWMCAEGKGRMRWGRVIDPTEATHDLSVDVVLLRDIVGPHHEHPKGEVCLTMPVTDGAKFDGQGAGWCVNEPGSAHNPTVSDGEAVVLYLLPDGAIKFTGK